MCGICGVLGDAQAADLEVMTRALAHRGPDGEGVFVSDDRRVGLGHRRLAVIDVADGAQPMWTPDGALGVVFNGEIYNHRELRTHLEGRGHVFATDHSDTEVLLHGYREWGDRLPEHLDGMFAFALFDRSGGRLLLSRDRMGEKPLYYAALPGRFLFASEPDALFRHPHLTRRFDSIGLQKFFAYGFSPADWTVFKDVKKLQTGHSMTVALDDLRPKTTAYWTFRLEPDRSLTDANVPDLAAELRHLLKQAVQRRSLSDQPLGVFLSGGIDSSAITALAAELNESPPACFCIGFHEKSFDETIHARTVAELVAADLKTRTVDVETMRLNAPTYLRRLGEPFGDPSLLPTTELSRFARENVTVALSGDGGDELFAGYDPFKALGLANAYQHVMPNWGHRALRAAVSRLPVSDRNMSLEFKLKRTLRGLSYPAAIWNPAWMSPIEPDEMAEFFAEPLDVADLYSEAIAIWNDDADLDLVDRTSEYFTRLYLPDDILTKSDRASMAHGLEVRSAFLDPDVVDFARRLPSSLKFRNGRGKFILRAALADVLPGSILDRPKKGFGIPLAKWLRTMDLELPSAPIDDMRLDAVARRWERHRRGAADERLLLWCWLSCQAVEGSWTS